MGAIQQILFDYISVAATAIGGTWNPGDIGSATSLSGGNLSYSGNNGSSARGTVSKSSGKWAWEITITSSVGITVGVATASANIQNTLGTDAFGWAYDSTGNKRTNNSASSYGSTYTSGDVIGIVLALTSGTLTFYKNGVSQGIAFSGLSGTLYPDISSLTGSNTSGTANFSGPFIYTYS